MFEIALKLIPVILIFLLGYMLKRMHVFKQEDGDLFLKIVFYLSLPALVILSVIRINLSPDFIYLPLIAILIIFITFILSFSTGKALRLPDESLGVFLTGTLIMNTNFLLPFFVAAYGEEGLARAAVFDFGNGFLAFTFVYYLACKYGQNDSSRKVLIRKFLLSPPLWSLFISIILNLSHARLPAVANHFLHLLGNMTIPLIMLSLGIYFQPKIRGSLPIFAAIFIRMFVGLLLGSIFAALFHLDGLNKSVVLISSAAPVGYNTLTFASMEKLDREFAADIVSFSLLIGIVFIPFLIAWLA
jgi:hypothetical protein